MVFVCFGFRMFQRIVAKLIYTSVSLSVYPRNGAPKQEHKKNTNRTTMSPRMSLKNNLLARSLSLISDAASVANSIC